MRPTVENPIQRAQRIAAEVQADPEWSQRPDEEAFEEYVRRVRALERATPDTTNHEDRSGDDA